MKSFLFTLFTAALLVGCVPRNQYNAAQSELTYYRAEAAKADSLEALAGISTYDNQSTTDIETQQLIRQIETLKATNISLNQSFQDLTARFEAQVENNIELTQATGSQVSDLQQSLADRKAEISQQEQLLRDKEIELYQREQQLAAVSGTDPYANSPATYGSTSSPALNSDQQAAVKQNQLQAELRQALVNINYTDVRFGNKGPKDVVLTLSQPVLFSNGYTLSDAGSNLIARIAGVLQRYPEAEIRVIGHSDPSRDPIIALENSTDRAISITQALVSRGINARRVFASGQGAYNPVTLDNSPAGQAENRRTEILIVLP